MKKIQLQYSIDLYSELSYEKIEEEVKSFIEAKKKELVDAGMKNKFTLTVTVRMLNKSISL